MRRDLTLSISTLGCPELSLPQAAALAAEYGVRKLELRALNGDCRLATHLREAENAEAFAAMAAQGRITALDSGFRLCEETSDFSELQDLGAIADAHAIPCIRVFPGFPYEEGLTPRRVQCARENLARYRAGGHRTPLALETHDGLSSAVRMAEFFDLLGEPLPVIWDIHHTTHAGGEEFRSSWRRLQPWVMETHWKDSRIQDGRRLNCLQGQGDFPTAEALDFLEAEAPSLPIVWEYERLWQKHLPPVREGLEAFLKFFE